MSHEELGSGPNSEKAIAESIRAKTLEFEREREAYIHAAKQLLAPPPPPEAEALAAATGASNTRVGNERIRDGGAEGTGETWGDHGDDGRRHHHCQQRRQDRQGPRRSRPLGGVARSRAASLREAREERRLASEEIRTLQHRKADAKVRLQAERLSNLEHGLELGVLRLERLLDRERILELLRLTDPNRAAATRAAELAKAVGKGGEGGGEDGDEEEVPEELIGQLEDRVAEAEERVRVEASRVGTAVAGRLEERARREENSRREESLARDEIVRMQTTLRDKEERLATTVISYLELRHAMLRAQRVASEAREDSATGRAVDEEEVRKCRSYMAEQTRAIREQVERTCEDVGGELHRQIQLREDEACMLQEQRAEAEELYEARAVRLESLLEEWKTRHAALRRRFSLETEGFRRDADNIGRRFDKIRAGPPGGRPPISSRSGSSARNAVERAIYSGGGRGGAALAAAAVAAAGGDGNGRALEGGYQ
eukprot:g2586.t1